MILNTELVGNELRPSLSTADEYGLGRLIVPNVEVVGPRLLVYPRPVVTDTTPSGLLIPASASERAREAIVLIPGDGVMLSDGTMLPSRVRPGDVIIYAQYAGIELEMHGFTYLLIQESDVRVVVTYKSVPTLYGDDDGQQGISDA